MSEVPKSKCYGLFRRKEVWALTWRARLLLLALFLGVAISVGLGIHPFLALRAPVESGILVVEGWIPEYALTNFVAQNSNFDRIYTTGGPTLTDRHSKDASDTYAWVAMRRLHAAGVPTEKLVFVPCWISRRDRTYSAALALREWCATNQINLKAFNVVTLGVHARRSRLIAEKAFPEAQVGVIPLLNEGYEPAEWWRYSEGVKEVLSETAAYLYARFLFSPE